MFYFPDVFCLQDSSTITCGFRNTDFKVNHLTKLSWITSHSCVSCAHFDVLNRVIQCNVYSWYVILSKFPFKIDLNCTVTLFSFNFLHVPLFNVVNLLMTLFYFPHPFMIILVCITIWLPRAYVTKLVFTCIMREKCWCQ